MDASRAGEAWSEAGGVTRRPWALGRTRVGRGQPDTRRGDVGGRGECACGPAPGGAGGGLLHTPSKKHKHNHQKGKDKGREKGK